MAASSRSDRTAAWQAGTWQAVTWQAGTLAGLALLALVSAVGVLLAPVIVDDPVVSWPRAGEQPRTTVLPLVPYRPLSVDATVPCAALAALDQRAGGGDALRTQPPSIITPDELDIPVVLSKRAKKDPSDQISAGLVVAAHRGMVQITASGTTVLRETLVAGRCTYRIVADAGGLRVLRDGVQRAAAAVPVPEVGELATDLEGRPAAQGLAVSLHTDARYESKPTPLKIVLLVLHGVALLVLLGLAWRWWAGMAVQGQASAHRRRRFRAADAVLVIVAVVWVVLAPTNFDDPWYLLMARGADTSGSIGNAIYMFNVTENPFVASQYVLQAWGGLGQSFGVGWGLAWMRLVPLIYGLLTWVLLRTLLVRGFGRDLGTGKAVWALLVAYLLWWLPYGMTLRPEPLIVLLAAATLVLAELARQRRSIGALAAATATAALAVSVSPSGLVAMAPLVLALPWLWAWLREQRTGARVAAVLLLAAAGTSLVPVGFADATLGDFLESAAVHQWYYDTFAWFEELAHYRTILSLQDSSQWARRAPVVLTVAVLAVIALNSVVRRKVSGPDRRTDDDPVRRLLVNSAACSVVALALLAPTPTKWVNHFGAAAAAPTVLLAAALLCRPLGPPLGFPLRRDLRTGAAIAAAAIVVGAVSLSFAGPNLWRPYSDRGQPFGDHIAAVATASPDLGSMRLRLGPVQLANPLLWMAVALAAGCWVWWRYRRGQGTGLTPDRAVLLTGSTTLVVMTIVVFVWAPLRQYPGWSVAMSAAHGVFGQPCVLAEYAQVLVDTAVQPVPIGPAIVEGSFAAAAEWPLPVPAPAPGTLVWHNAVPAGPQTGLLVTPWFDLPANVPTDDGTHLLVPLLGARAGQGLILEYATAAGPNPAVAGSVALPVDLTVPRTQWQQAAVTLHRLGDARPSSVRLVILDLVSGTGNWFAVGQPRLADWRPLVTQTAGRPVYVDQITATLLPCVDQVGVEHGIARMPQMLVQGDEAFHRGFLDLVFEDLRGGTQVQAYRSGTTVRVPTRLMPSGPATLPWGRVERVVYDHPIGLVDLRVETLRRAGWTRLPTLADKSYRGDL
ncbi:MAG: arabinosyltransferase domain-containing protein [Actinomycetota bacterium]|nr:arabinosyltransferase domain-containing protein [Actinomycetota bacterium]